jgi:hypothetical protein
MALSKKQMIVLGGISLAALGAYLLFRTKKIRFFDNVWCSGDKCENITECFGSPQAYLDDCASGVCETDCPEGDGEGRSDFENTGYLNLLFPEPHGLKAGDKIFIEQDAGATYPEYDGANTVEKVLNDYIIRTDKARRGSTPVEGGTVTIPSRFSKLF